MEGKCEKNGGKKTTQNHQHSQSLSAGLNCEQKHNKVLIDESIRVKCLTVCNECKKCFTLIRYR